MVVLAEGVADTTSSLIQGLTGAGNFIFIPFMMILYNLFVVWPNQILYWFLSIIRFLTGFDSYSLNNALFNTQEHSLTKFTSGFLIFGLVLGMINMVIGTVKILISNKDENKKIQLQDLAKKGLMGLLLSISLPFIFIVLNTTINTIFSGIFTLATRTLENQTNQGNYHEIIRALKGGNENLNVYELMARMITFNTWTIGYNKSLFVETSNGFEIRDGIKTGVIDAINRFSENYNSSPNIESGIDLFKNASDIGNWNILLSGIASIVILFGVITFLVSLLIRLLWLYILILISPIMIGASLLVNQNINKFLLDFLNKIILVQAGIVGYFLFNMLYSIITIYLYTIPNNILSGWTVRLLQFGIMFAGISLVNLIPQFIAKYFNSNEQVVGNEISIANSQIRQITSPLKTATISVFSGISGLASRVGKSTNERLGGLNGLGNTRLTRPQSLDRNY